jgi:hypothetical protein
VAVAIDSTWLPAWADFVLDQIQSSSWGTVALVVEGVAASSDSVPRAGRGRLLAWYVQADERWFGRECRPDALAPRPVDARLAKVHRVRPADRGLGVDVIVDFRMVASAAPLATPSRLGVWSVHPGVQPTGAAPPGHREVIEGEPLTTMTVEESQSWSGARVIETATCRTDDRSMRRNANQACWQSAAMLLRALERAQQGALDPGSSRSPAGGSEPAPPTSTAVLASLARLAGRTLTSKMRSRAFRERWGIGFHLHPGEPGPVADRPLSFIEPPNDRTWADPFVLKHEGRHFVFFEELPFATNRGHIAALEIASSGEWVYRGVVLEHDHHLSYPFLFTWQDELFMVPEQSAARRVQMYRCVGFPDRWQPEHVLLEGVRAVDATLHVTIDGWWMFANVALPGASSEVECHLFHAPAPTGPWTVHRASPIRRDVRTARPAGRLFERNGRLFRPSQDSSRRYGGAICVNEVRRLDPDGYAETSVGRIDPTWRRDIVAVHTLNGCDGATVVDVLFENLRLAS